MLQVRDALHAKATFLGKTGERDAATKAYAATEEKTASGGSKADMVFSQIRCAVELASSVGVHQQLGCSAAPHHAASVSCAIGQCLNGVVAGVAAVML